MKIEAKCGDPVKKFHRHINGTGVAQRISVTIKNTGDCPILVGTTPPAQRPTFTTRAQADPGETGSGTVEVAAGGALLFVWECKKTTEEYSVRLIPTIGQSIQHNRRPAPRILDRPTILPFCAPVTMSGE